MGEWLLGLAVSGSHILAVGVDLNGSRMTRLRAHWPDGSGAASGLTLLADLAAARGRPPAAWAVAIPDTATAHAADTITRALAAASPPGMLWPRLLVLPTSHALARTAVGSGGPLSVQVVTGTGDEVASFDRVTAGSLGTLLVPSTRTGQLGEVLRAGDDDVRIPWGAARFAAEFRVPHLPSGAGESWPHAGRTPPRAPGGLLSRWQGWQGWQGWRIRRPGPRATTAIRTAGWVLACLAGVGLAAGWLLAPGTPSPPRSGPVSAHTVADPPPATCWNGTRLPYGAACALPVGVVGLRHVARLTTETSECGGLPIPLSARPAPITTMRCAAGHELPGASLVVLRMHHRGEVEDVLSPNGPLAASVGELPWTLGTTMSWTVDGVRVGDRTAYRRGTWSNGSWGVLLRYDAVDVVVVLNASGPRELDALVRSVDFSPPADFTTAVPR